MAIAGMSGTGIQFIVQRRLISGEVTCTGFEAPAAIEPALVLILAAKSDVAEKSAQRFERDLKESILRISESVEEIIVPCGGGIRDPRMCQGHAVPYGRKILVIIGDSTTLIPKDPLIDWWLANGPSYIVLPVLPSTRPIELLPESLEGVNVVFFDENASERADDTLALINLSAEDRRVFVSYKRDDAQGVADQLFEMLQKNRFDVFVDLYRIPPGRDVQAKLTDELAHKSMIVVLESPHILDSEWIAIELAFAQKHELGRLAVHLPGAKAVPWIDEKYRVRIGARDVDPILPSKGEITLTHRLTDVALRRVARRLVEEHTLALFRRRVVLIDSLRVALNRRGVTEQRIDEAGHLHVKTSGAKPKEYVIWATPRPPEIDDFRKAHGVCDPGPDPLGALVTPVLYEEAVRRDNFTWLAQRSLVQLRDAGRIGEIADRIAAGKDI